MVFSWSVFAMKHECLLMIRAFDLKSEWLGMRIILFFYLKHWWSYDDLGLWRNTDGFWWSTFWTWNMDGHWWYVFILKYGWLLSIRISGEILIAFLKKCSSFAFGQIVSSTLSRAENCLLALRTPSLVPPTLLLSPHWNYP